MLVALATTACSARSEAAFPALGQGQTGGVVAVDSDRNGAFSSADERVQGASIALLFLHSGDTDAEPVLRPVPNTPIAVTGVDGTFILPEPGVVGYNQFGVQVAMSAALLGGAGTGEIHFQSQVTQYAADNVVLLDTLPSLCSAPAGVEDQAEHCDTLLPDLSPITRWSQVEVQHREQLLQAGDFSRGLLPTETWFVVEEEGRTRLRFSSLAANLGPGILDVIGAEKTADQQATWQRLWSSDLRYWDRPAGNFEYHAGHAHIHFGEFERYRLLDDDGHVLAESTKVSFCLRDSARVSGTEEPVLGVFSTQPESCGADQQAINPGWADHYPETLPDQWIDVTGVPPGDYFVEITVDPMDLLLESDETNNQAMFEVTID